MNGTQLLVLFCSLAGVLCAETNNSIFVSRIEPILVKQCGACHVGKEPKSGLSVDSYSALLVGGKHGPGLIPGSAKTSGIIQYLTGEKTPRMPLGGSLPESDIRTLAEAINLMTPETGVAAAKDKHMDWLLSLPKSAAPPKIQNSAGVKNPIDAFILAKLESKGMQPASPADPRVLIRRVYFDLIGLPPTPREVDAFVSSTDPKAYEKLIDQLLDDPRYGERWGRHWLDLARYAESDGFAVDMERPTAWRYRDYVIRAFNEDKPYDVFVKEQIAADEYRPKDDSEEGRMERLPALGFLRMATWEIDATSKQQLRQDWLNEITGSTASVFLGLTVGCAQCHNHKYDPIPQRDFYRLQSFFAATAPDDVPATFSSKEHPDEMKRLFRDYEDQVEAARKELDRRKELLKSRFIESKNLKPDAPAVAEFVKELGVANVFFQERTDSIYKEDEWKQYVTAKEKLQRLDELKKRYLPVAYAVKDVVPPSVPEIPAVHVLRGGELTARAESVEPGFLQCVVGKPEDAKIPFRDGTSGRRVALAEWIANPQNPLTARVMVNRIWQYHFGEGLVRTPSDFGLNGARPTHPELLDWLASEFVKNNWSIKSVHRIMLTSSTYRQSTESPFSQKYADIDPGNELLWRMNWGRLDSESLRDSILSLGGTLNTKSGGPGALLDAPADVIDGFEFFKWFPSEKAEQDRRTVYTFQRRSVVNPMLETFDTANSNSSCARRNITTVAPQALTLINGELVDKQARQFAGRLATEAGSDYKSQVGLAFRLALGRAPRPGEEAKLLDLARKFPPAEALRQLAVVLFNMNEFIYIQ